MQAMIKVPSIYSLLALNSAWIIHELQGIGYVLICIPGFPCCREKILDQITQVYNIHNHRKIRFGCDAALEMQEVKLA